MTHNIVINEGKSIRLVTAGKYCDKDIVVEIENYNNSIVNGTIKEFNNNIITSIKPYAFYNCVKLKNVNVPAVTSIGNDAFYNCIALENITVSNATTIQDSAFRLCSNLSSLDFLSVTKIGNHALRNCEKLQSLILRTEEICTLGTNALTSTPIANGMGYIYVPSALIETYKMATNWSDFASQFRAIEDYSNVIGE